MMMILVEIQVFCEPGASIIILVYSAQNWVHDSRSWPTPDSLQTCHNTLGLSFRVYDVLSELMNFSLKHFLCTLVYL